MRIALVVDAYAPARTSAAVQMRDLAAELRAQGHAPTVIVPSAELEAPWAETRVDGVPVLRMRAFRTKDIGHARRALAEVALPAAMLRNLAASPYRDARWDGVAWYSPTICFGPFVAALKRRSGCRGYLILRDLFPDWALDAGVMRDGPVYRAFKLIERYQYSVADVIGVQADGNLRYLAGWAARRPGRRLEVLDNWLAEAPAGAFELPAPLRGTTVFVYAGNMGVAQGMDGLVELARALADRTDVGMLFVGRGSEVPRLRTTLADLPRVAFLDEVEPRDVPGVLARCHIGLLALDPRHRTHNIPGKFLTYLRAGLPVLARINPGDLAELIRVAQVGLVSTGEPLAPLAAQLLADPAGRARMGEHGIALAHARFSPQAAARKIVDGLRA